MKTDENQIFSIHDSPQNVGEPDTDAINPTNGESSARECPLRNTCKMPAHYCGKAGCEDWFF